MSLPPETMPVEKPQTMLAVPVGLASPLWGLFAGAAATGAAWWWMTRWARPANLEAMFTDPETVEAVVEATPELIADAIEVSFEPTPQAAVEVTPGPVIEPVVEAAPEPAVEAIVATVPEPVLEAVTLTEPVAVLQAATPETIEAPAVDAAPKTRKQTSPESA